ncbi:bifunctional serine/threonine-protein kinase/ABC transporter substrate-binding protein [Calothrix sp. PCC 7507]|uniref:bifunctional serine/threonine-protein kinase/ABC transporter substrate-binding protein n=1 Tax=Calothrix sp. PCC 7507 TaxID=99598 RepID=UPI00029F1B40|nr:bifunctional serine/threonine-protein kinase/ABC transporter substrate-binding protein [Calothrix sp. PCC 7507]AFY31737.1 serine/threonine protein kinase [Calothrix sp. PCC 7507]
MVSEHEPLEKIRVICTRPRKSDEPPHWNEIPAELLNSNEPEAVRRRAERKCEVCGMSLILQGRYVPISELGQGGFGRTFQALDCQFYTSEKSPEQQKIQRVIKQFRSEKFLNSVNLNRAEKAFDREKNILAELEHLQIPTIFEYFKLQAEADIRPNNSQFQSNSSPINNNSYLFFIVQKYVEGQDLNQELITRLKYNNRYLESEVLDILKQILNVLHHIHTRQEPVIHRDIKPANIVHSIKEGKYYLVDFGAVKQIIPVVEQGFSDSETGFVTEGISPPEQLNRKVYPSSDLFSLAITCVMLLTGKLITSDSHSSEDIRIFNIPYNRDKWQKYAQIQPGLTTILSKMLELDPKNRYQSANEVLQELDKLEKKPPFDWQRVTPVLKPFFIGAGALLVLLVLSQILPQSMKCNFQMNCLTRLPEGEGTTGRTTSTSTYTPAPTSTVAADQLISAGNKRIYGSIKLTDNYERLKVEGIRLFDKRQYQQAHDKFQEIRNQAKTIPQQAEQSETVRKKALAALQDPEVVIYHNNAIARLRHERGQPIYTIAVAIPVSDKSKTTFQPGKQILFGVAQAQSKALDQNINLEVVIANDLNSIDQAENVAKKLATLEIKDKNGNSRKILAVIGHYTNPVTCKILALYENVGLPVISATSTLEDFRNRCGASNVFRTTSSTVVEAKSLVGYLRLRNIANPKIAIFFNGKEDYSRDLASQFQLNLGKNSNVVVNDKLFDSNFSAVDAVNNVSNADVFVILPSGITENSDAFKNAIKLLEASQNNNLLKLILGANTLSSSEEYLNAQLLGKLAGKLFIAVDWHPKCSNNDFVENVKNKWAGGEVNQLTASSYEAVQALEEALQKLPSTTAITRENLQQQLRNISLNSDVFKKKTISFDDRGDRNEIKTRILTTPQENGQGFELAPGETCPQN